MRFNRSPIARCNVLPFRTASSLAVFCFALSSLAAQAQTLERVAETTRLRAGYLADAAPFTYGTDGGTVEGYGAALCDHIAEQVGRALGVGELTIDWLPVSVEDRLYDVQQGRVDLLCMPTNVTVSRRRDVSFSIPVFLGGTRAVLRRDASPDLRGVLAGARANRPVWRGAPAATVLQRKTFAVVEGSTTEGWIADRLSTFHIDAEVETVPDFRTALQRVVEREVDVLFGERALVMEAMNDVAAQDLVILDRLFTHEQAALALPRDDADFRVLVDAALSQLYQSESFEELYIRWLGDFDESTRAFFEMNALPD